MSTRSINRLSARFVETAKPLPRKPGEPERLEQKFGDGDGLCLHVRKVEVLDKNGATKIEYRKTWEYRRMIGRKPYSFGLGSYPHVSLAAARTTADKFRQSDDPRKIRLELQGKLNLPTLRRCMVECVEKKRPVQSKSYTDRWYKNFDNYVYPITDELGVSLGDLPMQAITTEHIVKVLEPIWYVTPKTGEHVQFMLSMVFDYARVQYEVHKNPARWKDHLAILFPNPEDVAPVVHYRALPRAAAPAFFAQLRQHPMCTSSVATLLILLNPVRKSVALQAEWSEFDFVNRQWRIPASRMKTRRKVRFPNGVFVMPLSDVAIQVLTEWKKQSREKLVFPGMYSDTYLCATALNNFLWDFGYDSLTTPHGLRATFRTWVDQRTVCEFEVKEMALGHSLGKKTLEAYSREDWYEKRAILMDVWAEYLETGVDKPAIIGFREDARVILYRGMESTIMPGYKQQSERLVSLPPPIIEAAPAIPPRGQRRSRAPASRETTQALRPGNKRSSKKAA